MATNTSCVIVCLILMSYYKAEGIRTVSSDGKSATTLSIETTRGEIYDCVDFYKQPAFLNPVLRKSIPPKALESGKLAEAHIRQAPSGIGLKAGGCPFGTVPIFRTKNATKYDDKLFIQTITLQEDPHEQNHCYALVRTNDLKSSKYRGVGGDVTLYKPLVTPPQWSASRMRLVNGPESMEVGYMVNPDMFQDDNAHIYIRFMVNGGGCFNLECSGFVQVGKDIPIGIGADKVSERGGDQYYWKLSIEKHQDDGNWWLSFGSTKYLIGYWPKSLFSSLTETANQVEWGGEVYTASVKYDPPEMGNGYEPVYDTKKADFISNATLVDEAYQIVNPPKGTARYESCMFGYQVLDTGYQGEYWGRIIFFGGPHDA